jgi:Mrp family chromosome partitioning ATPase
VADFFDWARSNYDRVIIDSPPYGIVGDVVSLAVAVDSVIIMCCPDRTHFKPIRHCARTLTEAGANILGVVVNDVDYSNIGAFSVTHSHSYRKYGYGSYYYGYGYGGKRRSGKAAEDSDNDSPAENEGKSEYTDEE